MITAEMDDKDTRENILKVVRHRNDGTGVIINKNLRKDARELKKLWLNKNFNENLAVSPDSSFNFMTKKFCIANLNVNE